MIYLVLHDRAGILICAALIAFAVRVWKVAHNRALWDLDAVLGPERVEHVKRGQAWERMTRGARLLWWKLCEVRCARLPGASQCPQRSA